ncbi:reverse transcriptase [Phytophthora megakarya]|uniref:Reverse transcriptase n=1 Tax=Phytophthora megakarya TaxID=4795 RepID=A0A225WEK3_9STRA|nr:reverse transcriptase [Phytophthora megakarya]
MRLERIAQAQGEEKWIADLRTYLTGAVADLTAKDAQSRAKIADSYEPMKIARIKQHFHWRGLFRDVQRYVGEYVDCETGKGRPAIQGRLPGNLQATYPFQIIAMDHIPSLPKSYKGNTELLIWADLFTGYVLVKASGARTAQQIA